MKTRKESRPAPSRGCVPEFENGCLGCSEVQINDNGPLACARLGKTVRFTSLKCPRHNLRSLRRIQELGNHLQHHYDLSKMPGYQEAMEGMYAFLKKKFIPVVALTDPTRVKEDGIAEASDVVANAVALGLGLPAGEPGTTDLSVVVSTGKVAGDVVEETDLGLELKHVRHGKHGLELTYYVYYNDEEVLGSLKLSRKNVTGWAVSLEIDGELKGHPGDLVPASAVLFTKLTAAIQRGWEKLSKETITIPIGV